MPRVIALEWDDLEVRVLLASTRGGSAVIENAAAVALEPTDDPARHAVELSASVAEAVKQLGAASADALVSVARPDIEWKELELPPCPDDELPDLVRFQAQREFTNVSDEWTIDFVPLRGGGTEPRVVLAVAATPRAMHKISALATASELDVKRIAPRPCGAASLLRRRRNDADETSLLADIHAGKLDLTVLASGQIVYLRSTRLSDANGPELAKFVSAEIRRTMAAARQSLAGREVQNIFVCGDSRDSDSLANEIGAEFGIEVRGFDPFAGIRRGSGFEEANLASPGRYAALLGMVFDEAAAAAPPIDLKHPRRRKEQPTRTQRLRSPALVAVGVVALAALFYFFKIRSLNDRIDELSTASQGLKGEVEEFEKQQTRAQSIEGWTNADFVWLDELAYLSRRFVSADDAKINQLSFAHASTGRNVRQRAGQPTMAEARVGINGVVRDTLVLEKLHGALASGADRRLIPGGHGAESGRTEGRYDRTFDVTIQMRPQSSEEYARDLAAKADDGDTSDSSADEENNDSGNGGIRNSEGSPETVETTQSSQPAGPQIQND